MCAPIIPGLVRVTVTHMLCRWFRALRFLSSFRHAGVSIRRVIPTVLLFVFDMDAVIKCENMLSSSGSLMNFRPPV